MSADTHTTQGMSYLDVQAEVGVTKHAGGYPATRALLALCHVKNCREVLYVGCGTGVGPAFIARTLGCHVVGVDISDRMIEWSLRRVRKEGLEDRVELVKADVLALPFEDNRFDAVLCESVLAFVGDKRRAIRECVRVTAPGGYVGVNESTWVKDPSPAIVAMATALGTEIPTPRGWEDLWSQSGLEDRVARVRHTSVRDEVRSRIRWIGWGSLLPAWGRALRLYITNPAGRQAIKEQFSTPLEVMEHVGYEMLVGRKPGSPLPSA